MNFFSLLPSEKKSCWLLEIILAVILFGFAITLSYFLFLKSALTNDAYARHHKKLAMIRYRQKMAAAQSDAKIVQALAHFQKENPQDYNNIKINPTDNQLIQLLTQTAEQAGFSISQITSVKNKNIDIQLTVSGHYQSLFDFINRLNKLTWPFQLIALKIPQAKEFHFVFQE